MTMTALTTERPLPLVGDDEMPVLKVVAHSVVETRTRPIPLSRISWEQTRELFRYQSGGQFDAATEFVFASPFVPKQAEFAAYSRPTFTPCIRVLADAQDLMRPTPPDVLY